MKLKFWLPLSLLFLVAIACTNQSNDKSVSQATPSASTSAQAQQSDKSGTFVSGEHPTQGTVRLIYREGKSALEFDGNFQTSELGPDLVIILHRSDNVIGSTQPPAYPIQEGEYAIIAPLQKFSGTQSYTIPDNINPADYQSVAIWCRKFNATFGAAFLQ